jgi:hypothetical protein
VKQLDPAWPAALMKDGIDGGIGNRTTVAWHPRVVDAVFDLLGNYDGDGITSSDNGTVNNADYTIWFDNQDSTTDLSADGNDNGIVDDDDYDIWQDNFNNTLSVIDVLVM